MISLPGILAFLGASRDALLRKVAPILYPPEESVALPQVLIEVAGKISANPEDLHALIQAESAWNPNAYNASGAVGLIQFMPQTLKDFGLLSAGLAERVPSKGAVPEGVKQAVRHEFLTKWPTIEAQLRGPVVTYFTRYKPFPTRQSLYLSVFYPAYRNAAPDTAFPASVRAQNPGIDTVADYVDHVEKRRIAKAVGKPLGMATAALAIIGALWYIGRRGGFT